PFVTLAEQLGAETIKEAFTSFYLDQQITIPGFVAQTLPTLTPTPETTATAQSTSDFIQQALGQGDLTVSPMNIALMAAAAINNGNAPQPYALLSVHPPEASDWIANSALRRTLPFMTTETAAQLRDIMQQALQERAGSGANMLDLESMGEHVALAYSGEGVQSWFMGFTLIGKGQGIVTAVILENSDDLERAVEIGRIALNSGRAALTD